MAEKLVDIPLVTRLSPRVIRILGANPGKFTLQGTNTYLISPPVPEHSHDSAQTTAPSLPSILIDAAEGVSEHLDALRNILAGKDERVGPVGVKRHVTDIILSHWHHDHVQGLPALLKSLDATNPPPRIHKYLNSAEDAAIESSLSSSGSLQTFTDDHRTFSVGDGDLSVSLDAYHTPGHTTDHLSFLLPSEGIFFSGDNVLGQGTSVFEDLSAYLASLQRSVEIIRADSKARDVDTILPAHGPVIERKGVQTLEMYIRHRLEREQQVLDLLKERGPLGLMQIVEVLYAQYPPSLHPAAARGIYLHLHKLHADGKVSAKNEEDTPPTPTLPFDASSHVDFVWSLQASNQKARV